MKTKIDRMKNRAKSMSKRSLALMLSILVLMTAVGAGAVFTAIAATTDGQSVSERIEATANRYDTEETMLNGAPDAAAAENDTNADADVADAVTLSKKGDTDLTSTGWDTTNCGVHYKLGSGSYDDVNTNSSGLATITVSSSTTITYTLFAEYDGYKRWYKKASSTRNPSASSSQTDDYYAKYEQEDGNSEFSVSVTAGTYNIQFDTIEQDGKQLKYHFWKTNTSYSISYNSPTNGSFTTKPTSATSGSTVTFVATPANGYEVDTVTITNSSTSAAISPTINGTTYKFTMPAANVSVSATFKKAKYTITANTTACSVTGFTSPAEYGSTVSFTITPDTDYALKTLTVKQGTTTVSVNDNGGGSYSFTMPAGAVTITATCTTTSGTAEIYFKSATAWVYHPFISINGGAEQEMTLGNNPQFLDNGAKSSAVKPKSDTGSLRYAWYKIDMTGIDTSKPVTIKIRGNDTYMEAEGTFTIGSGDSLYLACDNLMEGSTLVDVSSLSEEARDFYDTPLNMIDD